MKSKTRQGLDALIRPDIADLEEYAPVLPVEELARRVGVPVERIVKLDGNENPYGPSPRVRAALAEYAGYQIYPDPMHGEARRLVAEYVGADVERVMLGNGSDELIDLVMRLVLTPGDRVINCVPTFGMYSFNTGICAGVTVEVPRRADYSLNLPAILAAVDDRTKLVIVTSPNNPTGNLPTEQEIRAILETGVLLLVDEAYYEFAGRTFVPLTIEYENLVILRTFSKWAGLAGLRVGYGVFPAGITRHLWKIKPPYNVNVAALVAVRESLLDRALLDANAALIVKERDRLFAALSRLDFLRPVPSSGNYIFCPVVRGEAKAIRDGLARRGVFIRYYTHPLLRNSIRVSVGKPAHTDAAVAALRDTAAELGI